MLDQDDNLIELEEDIKTSFIDTIKKLKENAKKIQTNRKIKKTAEETKKI